MAEENTNKRPKTTLIKHKRTSETPDHKTTHESKGADTSVPTEKKKVVVVKKKKVVVKRPVAHQPAQAEKKQTEEKEPRTASAPQTSRPQQPGRDAGPAQNRPSSESRGETRVPRRDGGPSSADNRTRPNYNQSNQGRPQGGDRPAYQGSRPQGDRPAYNGSRPQGTRPPYNGSRPQRPGGFNQGGAGAPKKPAPIEGQKPIKKVFKAKNKKNYQKNKKDIYQERDFQIKKKAAKRANPVPKRIDIMEVITVSELARKMNLKASELISKLMKMGMMVTINQQIDADTATIIASEYECEVNIVSLYDETVIETEKDADTVLKSRPPIVTVMGHVDHGKTKLLDAIREANVVAGEFGGITQHIGAYSVKTDHGEVVFLDTPGHSAFTLMRARGAQVTDIVILVVAANDGVMPQTIEAINHAKEADVPIIVAVNKIDLPESNVDRVKQQLSEYNLLPESWGGSTMFCEISALKKEGIEELVEAILLQSEMLELTANYDCRARAHHRVTGRPWAWYHLHRHHTAWYTPYRRSVHCRSLLR